MATADPDQNQMPRALLTDGERDALQDPDNLTNTTVASHRSRIRGKRDRLRRDGEILRQHDEELYRTLRDAFLGVDTDDLRERVMQLEGEVERLRAELDD